MSSGWGAAWVCAKRAWEASSYTTQNPSPLPALPNHTTLNISQALDHYQTVSITISRARRGGSGLGDVDLADGDLVLVVEGGELEVDEGALALGGDEDGVLVDQRGVEALVGVDHGEGELVLKVELVHEHRT